MYLDPGFGGMLLQALVIIGAVGGGILYSVRKKIRKLFSKDKQEDSKLDDFSMNSDDDAVDMLDND
ncbi:MAG: hypothetical protein FWF81_14145 [Defluviitaleaceae bacterium]|nr:hypothetical protein [Defluviitaleaceae bacterium]